MCLKPRSSPILNLPQVRLGLLACPGLDSCELVPIASIKCLVNYSLPAKFKGNIDTREVNQGKDIVLTYSFQNVGLCTVLSSIPVQYLCGFL